MEMVWEEKDGCWVWCEPENVEKWKVLEPQIRRSEFEF